MPVRFEQFSHSLLFPVFLFAAVSHIHTPSVLSPPPQPSSTMKFLPSVLSLLASAGLALAATAASASASPSSPSNKNIKRAYSSTYADELTDGTACRDVTVLYARGTGQSGNIGAATDVGPEFLDALAALVGARGLAAQGVDYSASVEGFEEGGDPAGSALMAELAELVRFCEHIHIPYIPPPPLLGTDGFVNYGRRRGAWLADVRENTYTFNRHTPSAPTLCSSCPGTARAASSSTTRRTCSPPRSRTLWPPVRVALPRDSQSQRKRCEANLGCCVHLVLIFGDPDNGDAVGDIADDKVHIICRECFLFSRCCVFVDCSSSCAPPPPMLFIEERECV